MVARRIKRVKRPTDGPSFYVDLLAADRVYLLRMSPYVATVSYLELDAFAPKSLFQQAGTVPFTLTSEEAVSFLWHFP